jgi:hypothetical protein
MSRQPPVERLAWLINRLRCMSVGEVGYRMQRPRSAVSNAAA